MHKYTHEGLCACDSLVGTSGRRIVGFGLKAPRSMFTIIWVLATCSSSSRIDSILFSPVCQHFSHINTVYTRCLSHTGEVYIFRWNQHNWNFCVKVKRRRGSDKFSWSRTRNDGETTRVILFRWLSGIAGEVSRRGNEERRKGEESAAGKYREQRRDQRQTIYRVHPFVTTLALNNRFLIRTYEEKWLL